jgi:hypothetical protein
LLFCMCFIVSPFIHGCLADENEASNSHLQGYLFLPAPQYVLSPLESHTQIIILAFFRNSSTLAQLTTSLELVG